MKFFILILINWMLVFQLSGQNIAFPEEESRKRSYLTAFAKYASNWRNGDNAFTIELSSFANYEIIPHYLAVGAGIVASRTYDPNINLLAFTGEIKGFLSDELTTVYLYIQTGYGFSLGDLSERGMHFNPGIGYRASFQGHNLCFELSSSVKSISFDNRPFRESQDKTWVRGLYFGIGYQF